MFGVIIKVQAHLKTYSSCLQNIMRANILRLGQAARVWRHSAASPSHISQHQFATKGIPLAAPTLSIKTTTTTATITRNFSSARNKISGEKALHKRLDDFQDLFVEARLCIDDASDSAETTYFDEDVAAATEAVDEAVSCYNEILTDLADDEVEKVRVQRGNGLKVEQLKGELKLVLDGGHH